MSNPTIAPTVEGFNLTATPFSQLITPGQIQDTMDTLNRETSDPNVIAVEKAVASKLPAKVRAVIYEVGQWLGIAAAAGATVAGILKGDPNLYVGSIAGLLLAISNNIAKVHVGK